jgi:hypothetical protein
LEGFTRAEQAYLAALAQITADYQQALLAMRTEAQAWEAYRLAQARQQAAYQQISVTWQSLLQRYQALLLGGR